MCSCYEMLESTIIFSRYIFVGNSELELIAYHSYLSYGVLVLVVSLLQVQEN